MTRTFSKIYGLGGIRLGWAYCQELVADVLNRVRGPFNVNSVAQVAGIAAILDIAHTTQVRDHNKKWRAWTTKRLQEFDLSVIDSIGNFILCGFDTSNGKDAESADNFLKQKGILVRRMVGYGLPNHLRVTIGTQAEMTSFIDTIARFLEKEKT